MTEQEIKKIIRDEIKQLLFKFLNNAWETHEYGDYTINRPLPLGICIKQTLKEYDGEDNNDR